jgi:signal transduction histidine kinase
MGRGAVTDDDIRDDALARAWARVAAEQAALAAERTALERARTDLLATLAHELRTPLTLIRTSIGLLLDTDPEPVMRARLLRNIKLSSDRMHALVTDLLDLARLRGGRPDLRLRLADVGALATGAAALLTPLLEEKGQTLDLDLPAPPPQLLGDARRLEQVLVNLLSNAAKFSPHGARLRLSVADAGPEVILAVADPGPGIPPEALPRLFEQFYTDRTSSPGRNIGVGLGLPIAQGIVAAHGGRIWAESTVGVGSTFSVALPKGGPREEDDEDPGDR